MACGRMKQEKVRLCWKESVCFNDCNSNVAKIFKPPPCSVSYILATQVFRTVTLKKGAVQSQVGGKKRKFGAPTVPHICHRLQFLRPPLCATISRRSWRHAITIDSTNKTKTKERPASRWWMGTMVCTKCFSLNVLVKPKVRKVYFCLWLNAT
jgi:hypothetical protein